MKKTGIVAAVVAVCLILTGWMLHVSAAEKSSQKPAAQETGPKAKADDVKTSANSANVAVVNGTPIPKADFDMEVARLERQVAMTGRNTDEKEMAAMKKRILDGLVGRELLKQEAQKKKIKADDKEVNTQIDALKKKFGSEEEFQNTLAKMNLTEDKLKAQIASDLVLRALIDQEVASKITVGPNDAKEFYDKNPEYFKTPEMVRASHILVTVAKDATPEDKTKALAKIKDVQKKIQGGADFAEEAKAVSDCPSKEKGGDLDFFQKGQMVPAFETAAFALKPGQMSDVVETEYGYHLIKVTDKKEAGVVAFDEIKPRIEQQIKNEKVGQQLAQYVEQLKSKAKIETLVQ